MSGIAGIYYLDGQPVQYSDLARMTDVLSHRGPDGAEIWCGGSVGLGHRMLWTTPESLLEKLPLVKGNLTLTADARIDNREELIPALGFADYPADKVTDSDLILAAYEKWGTQCPEKLLGDFAFVIWDGRNQQLFCARDHFGVKPLYYYHQPGKLFAFASEIKALLALSDVPWQINEVRIADYLLQRYEDKASTFYQHIYRCVPAHSLRVTAEQLSLRAYWQLDPHRELRLSSDEEYAAAYREIFTEAVRCRLRSAFPIGSMLSGGLDSSSIVCVAKQLLPQQGQNCLKTFSLIFDNRTQCDERPFIQAVLEQGGVQPYFVHGDRLKLLADLTNNLEVQDEPFNAPNLFLHRALWTAAQQQNVRVLLDGMMGDGIISHGFNYLSDLAHSWRWLTLYSELHALAKRRNRSVWGVFGRYLWQDGLKPRLPQSIRFKLHLNNSQLSSDIPSALGPNLNHHVHSTTHQSTYVPWQSARQRHYQDLIDGYIPNALEIYSKGAAIFGLDARFPFLDRRVVEFCLAIPPSQKLHQGWNRMIVRRALANILPTKIQWRDSKGDLSSNCVETLLTESDYLQQVIQECSTERLNGYIDMAKLSEIYHRFSRRESITDSDITTLMLGTTVAIWLEQVHPVLLSAPLGKCVSPEKLGGDAVPI